MAMDVKPVVFAVVLGWISGDEQLLPAFSEWVATGRTPAGVIPEASCRIVDQDFVVRQVRLDLSPVEITKPSGVPEGVTVPN
jgi:hypothetical protein